MIINVINGPVSEEELAHYKQRAIEKFGDMLKEMDVNVLNEEDVEITYHLDNPPFERVRRITGYLVGTLDRWNNAKQAEERDRVKHDAG
jgi:hypothetical protein